MKYCNNTTTTHSISILHGNCLQNINDILLAESKECYDYVIPNFENNETVINLDYVEIKVAEFEGRQEKNKSMDMAFGLTNSYASRKEMVMVELRLNYRNPNNLNKSEIEGKVAGSIHALSDQYPIHEKYIFIFKTNQLAEAENRLFRMNPRVNSNYIVMDVEQLKTVYF